jgi:hypothetical protein
VPFCALSIRCSARNSAVVSLRTAIQSPTTSPLASPTVTTRVPASASSLSAYFFVLFPSHRLPLLGRSAITLLFRSRVGSSNSTRLFVGPSPRSTRWLHGSVIAAVALSDGSFTR